jgi:hypothetical protein
MTCFLEMFENRGFERIIEDPDPAEPVDGAFF